MTFRDDELSYALGKQGGTRKKLERASGAVVQYVGQVALFSGEKALRKKAKEYMKWLFDQLEGPATSQEQIEEGIRRHLRKDLNDRIRY